MMRHLIIYIIVVFSTLKCFSQEKDTIYIIFDEAHGEMKKNSFLAFKRSDDPNEVRKKSFVYSIKEKKYNNDVKYDDEFEFVHHNRNRKNYEIFGGKPPLKIVKDSSFLKTIIPLDIQFFRTTDYIKVCKTFEAENSWEQDVVIFMIDKDEIKDGKLVLREVKFSRPVKI